MNGQQPETKATEEKDIAKDLRNKVLKAVGGYGGTIAIIATLILLVVLGNNAEHKNSLIATLALMPIFALQVLLLLIVALSANFLVMWVRSRKLYDKHGPVIELKRVQDRVGTPDEKPNDSIALGLQFLANSLLIIGVIACFFLMRSGASMG